MASRTALLIAAAMAVVAVGALLPATASAAAAVHRVGDNSSWAVGVDYKAWAFNRTVKVGDTLEFLYSNATNNVVLVNEKSYGECTVPRDAPVLTSGDDRVVLWHDGEWFFISSFEGHCESGMKLALYVQRSDE